MTRVASPRRISKSIPRSPFTDRDKAHLLRCDQAIEPLIDLIDCIYTRWRLHMLNRKPYRWLGCGMSRGFIRIQPTTLLQIVVDCAVAREYSHVRTRVYRHQRPANVPVLVRSGTMWGLVWPHVYADCHLSSRLICHVLRYGDASDAVIIKMRISNNLRRI